MIDDKMRKQLMEMVSTKFTEFTSSSVYTNWKFLCENIKDAIEQRWRPAELKTRSNLYFGIIRASRDGLFEGFTETFGAASPLFAYRPRKNKYDILSGKVQDIMDNAWKDAGGTQKWLATLSDAIECNMGVTYVNWQTVKAMTEVPIVKPLTESLASVEVLEWTDEAKTVLDCAQITRVHPLNWRGDHRNGMNPIWEGLVWEWTITDLVTLIGNVAYDQEALKRVIEKAKKGALDSQDSASYYNTVDAYGGKTDSATGKIYAKEYWGPINSIEGREIDPYEYLVVCVGDEVIRVSVNKLVVGKRWRPIHRTVLHPSNDYPMGYSLLSPTLAHQRAQNWMRNTGIDDVMMRSHLGLAYWPDTIVNGNDLLNPEGARGLIAMREDADPNKMPKFFADGRSGVLYDTLQLDGVIDRDRQITGFNDQSLGMGGGGGGTATETQFLAKTGSRRMRSAIIYSSETGLQPMGNHILLLTLRNKDIEDLNITPSDLIGIMGNDLFKVSDAVASDLTVQQSALANFSAVAMQVMTQISQKDGNMNHVTALIKDMGKAYGLSSERLDAYFPDPGILPPEVGPQGLPPEMGGQLPAEAVPQEQVEAPMDTTGMSPEQLAALEAQ